MKKNNNKGFMLLETMVVSAFIITTLTFLYVQFSNLKKNYDESFKYDTIPELFKTKEIDKFINNNYGYADIINDVKESEDKYIELYNNSCNMTYFSKYNSYCNRLMNDMDVKTILLVSTDLSKLINKLKTNNKYSNGLYLYIKKINQSTNNNSYSLIVEFNDKKYTNLIVENNKLCVRANNLHTEVCERNDSLGCKGSGYNTGDTIKYGNLGTKGTLSSGDAFDCDVNGDGVYDFETERFYYVSDYYNTTTKTFENDTAVLLYYNNVSAGNPNDTTVYAYDLTNENWHGPRNAIKQLPTKNQWKNVKLKNTIRTIITTDNKDSTIGGLLPTNFSYEEYSARLLSFNEVINSCNINNFNFNVGLLDNCIYLMENTQFSNINKKHRYWLENPSSNDNIYIQGISSSNRRIDGSAANDSLYNYVRPVIEVPKVDIDF